MTPERLVRTPLFDRLAGAPRTLDAGGLRESVRRELELLFNTRSAFPSHRLAGAPLTVIDYGIPPLENFTAGNAADRAALADALRIAIETFEPRLRAVHVRTAVSEHEGFTLDVAFEAELLLGHERVPIAFAGGIDLRDGKVTLDARA